MSKHEKNFQFILPVLAILLCSSSFQLQDWVAPQTSDSISNPVLKNEKSVKHGEKLFGKLCASCHGEDGSGKGPASSALTTKPANLTDSIIHKQSDGALFWKISEGRGAMASFKHSLTTEQRWHLVNFIRTLKK